MLDIHNLVYKSVNKQFACFVSSKEEVLFETRKASIVFVTVIGSLILQP